MLLYLSNLLLSRDVQFTIHVLAIFTTSSLNSSNMRRIWTIRLAALLCATGAFATSQAELPVIAYQPGPGFNVNVYAANYEAFKTAHFTQNGSPVFPTHTTLEVTASETIRSHITPMPIPKTSHAKSVVDWEIIGDQYVLSIDMDHKWDGPSSDPYVHTFGSLNFTVDRDTPYELSGYYNVTDFADDSSGVVFMGVKLVGEVSGDAFGSHQISNMTHNEQFTLDSFGGDGTDEGTMPPDPNPTGTAIGMLNKGERYDLNFSYWIGTTAPKTFPVSSKPGASALGNFTFKIGVPPVPEPATYLLALPAIIAVWPRRRR